MESVNIFNDLSEHVALRIHSCQEIVHPGDWMERKAHKDYDLWLIESGQVSLKSGYSSSTANAGDIVLFYPHAPYTASTNVDGCRFIYVHFDFALGEHFRILDDFNLSGIVAGEIVYEEARLFRKSYSEYAQQASMSGIRLKGCFTILIARIIESYGKGEYNGSLINRLPRQRGHTRNLDELKPVFDFIQDNVNKSLKIKQLAGIAGLSEKYFITLFKNSLGITPGQYLYQLKMNKARDYLYQRKYTMREIADLLGYPDPYTFSKAFKKYYKVPPSQFL